MDTSKIFWRFVYQIFDIFLLVGKNRGDGFYVGFQKNGTDGWAIKYTFSLYDARVCKLVRLERIPYCIDFSVPSLTEFGVKAFVDACFLGTLINTRNGKLNLSKKLGLVAVTEFEFVQVYVLGFMRSMLAHL